MLCVYCLVENTKQLTMQCFFTGNLVPNVIAEVYFVVQLLTARGIALALKPTQGTCTVGRHDWRVSVFFNVAELSSRFMTSKSCYSWTHMIYSCTCEFSLPWLLQNLVTARCSTQLKLSTIATCGMQVRCKWPI